MDASAGLRARGAFDATLAALFVSALCAPAIDQLVRPDSARDARHERRSPAPRPSAPRTLAELAEVPVRYARHFEDTFGLRDRLLRWRSALFLFGLGVAPSPAIVLGRERWIFYAADGALEDFRGLAPRSSDWLAAHADARIELGRALARRGIHYVHAVAPNKETIYPERMSARWNRVGRTSLERYDALVHTATDPCYVDLRPALRAAKALDEGDDFAYSPHGTHWTWRGAHAAWRALRAQLSAAIPALARDDDANLRRVRSVVDMADSWAPLLFLRGWLTHADLQLESARTKRVVVALDGGPSVAPAPAGAPRVLVLHDSFGPWFLPFVREDAAELCARWEPTLRWEDVDTFRPDVVIEIFTERNLRLPPPPLQLEAPERTRAEFERFAPLGGPCDLAAERASVQPFGKTKLRPIVDAGRPALEIIVADVSDGIVLPRVELARESKLALRLDLSAPCAFDADLFYPSRDDPSFTRARSARLHVPAGRREVVVELFERGLCGSVLVHLGRAPGRHVLYALEQREVRP